MRYLLDTNAVSEFRRGSRINPGFLAWAGSVSVSLFAISTLTRFELEVGYARLHHRDPPQAIFLRRWIDEFVLPTFAQSTYPVTEEIAARCAPLHAVEKKPVVDSFIAATASVHGMVVITRNEKDFSRLDVPFHNPWT